MFGGRAELGVEWMQPWRSIASQALQSEVDQATKAGQQHVGVVVFPGTAWVVSFDVMLGLIGRQGGKSKLDGPNRKVQKHDRRENEKRKWMDATGKM